MNEAAWAHRTALLPSSAGRFSIDFKHVYALDGEACIICYALMLSRERNQEEWLYEDSFYMRSQ